MSSETDTGTDTTAPAPPAVGAISPVPTEEEAVAIVAALEVGWPRLVIAGRPQADQPPRWRFSGRWWSRPIPQRRSRP